MRKNIYKLYVTASLALLCIGISTSAFAGLFPIEIDITQKTPDCLDVYAGGVVGPGSGVTIVNDCQTPVTITGIHTGSMPFLLLRQRETSIYLSNSSEQYREVIMTAKGAELCRFAGLSPKENPPPAESCGVVGTKPCAPGHFKPPQEVLCRGVVLDPAESAFFVVSPEYFHIEGTNGLVVRGKSYFLR